MQFPRPTISFSKFQNNFPCLKTLLRTCYRPHYYNITYSLPRFLLLLNSDPPSSPSHNTPLPADKVFF